MTSKRILYAKGGAAIEEAQRLFPRAGVVPKGGPDQFLMAMLVCAGDSQFRLVSHGKRTTKRTILGRDAIEYGARPTDGGKLTRGFAYICESVRFLLESIYWKPSHVVCGLEGPFAVFALLAAKLSGARFLFSVHNALDLPSVSRASRIAHKILAKTADAIVVHGPFLREQMLGLGATSERVFEYNAALEKPHSKLVGPQDTLAIPAHAPIFFYAGRIEINKGAKDLLHAYEKVRNEVRCSLVYAGDGDYLAMLREEVAGSLYRDDIFVLGAVNYGNVVEYMKAAFAVVTPSQSAFPEGRCKTVMEAFVAGTPVISPDYGPFPYLVLSRVNGLLYKADSVIGLASAMRELLFDTALYGSCKRGAAISGGELLLPHVEFLDVIRSFIFSADRS